MYRLAAEPEGVNLEKYSFAVGSRSTSVLGQLILVKRMAMLTGFDRGDGCGARDLRLLAVVEIDTKDLGCTTANCCHVGEMCSTAALALLVGGLGRTSSQGKRRQAVKCHDACAAQVCVTGHEIEGEAILGGVPRSWATARTSPTLYQTGTMSCRGEMATEASMCVDHRRCKVPDPGRGDSRLGTGSVQS